MRPSARRSGRRPAYEPTTSARPSGPRQAGRHGGQQELDLLCARFRDVGRLAVDRLVGETEVDQTVGLGEHVEEAGVRAGHGQGQRDAEVGEGVAPHDQMGAPAGAQADVLHQAARPDPGGVDDGASAHVVRRAAELVAQRRPGAGDLDRTGPRAELGTEPDRRAGDRGDQAGVVLELAVPRQDPAADPGAEHGREVPALGGRDPARPRQRLAGGAGRDAEPVAGLHPGPEERGLPVSGAVVEGQEEGQCMGQVGCGDLHQDAALDGTLVGDADLAVGEVAQPAVHELAGPSRRPEREVVGVDGEHGQPARHGVEGDAGPGDAEPDDEDVDLARHLVEPGPDPAAAHRSTARRTTCSSSASRASSETSSSTMV